MTDDINKVESATTPAEVGEYTHAQRESMIAAMRRDAAEYCLFGLDYLSSAAHDYATLARQLAEAERQNKIMREADYHAAGVAQEQEIIELKSQLAEATRRLGEVEGLLREIRGDYEAGLGVTRESYDTFCRLGAHGTLPNDTWPLHFERRKEQIDAALTKEPTK